MLAPTGTIGLMMDCDTTGIEPDLALTKAKKLVGGGTMMIVNQTIPRALRKLGYSDEQTDEIIAYINEHKIDSSVRPHFKDEHLPVFACSMGDNTIHYMGHVKMMGRPSRSSVVRSRRRSTCPRRPRSRSVEQLYIDSWKLGLKAVAIYRDNCKVATAARDAEEGREGSLRGRRPGAERRGRAHRRDGDRAAAHPPEAAAHAHVEDVLVPGRRLPRVRDGR